jgi:N-acetylneuraminic acid mutarotase
VGVRCLIVACLLACLLATTGLACSEEESDTATGAAAGPSGTTAPTLPPADWQSLAPTGALPAACLGATLVCLPADGRLLLYGGWAGGGVYSGSIWVYDPATNTWTELRPQGVGPAPRATHAMVYDPVGGKAILFGGFDGISYYNDTWAYDPAANTWTNLVPAGSVPAKRSGHSLVYEPDSGKMILFGGWNGRVDYNDTWAYDPAANTWTNLLPAEPRPAARDSQALAYDADNKVMILFGGWSTQREFQDTWAYDPADSVWTDLAPAGEIPSFRALAQMVYDPRAERMVIFGGGSGTDAYDGTWHFDVAAKRWSMADLTGRSPSARTGYAMVYDPTGQRVVLFGGSDGSTFFNDLWILTR